jgi:hypothetical protein
LLALAFGKLGIFFRDGLLRVSASIRSTTSLIYQIAHGLRLPAGGTFRVLAVAKSSCISKLAKLSGSSPATNSSYDR